MNDELGYPNLIFSCWLKNTGGGKPDLSVKEKSNVSTGQMVNRSAK